MIFKVLAFIYFKVFCSLFWYFAKFRNRFEPDQNHCNICSGSLDAKQIAKIDLAGYVSLLDSSFLGSVFYRLRFLFFWPWLCLLYTSPSPRDLAVSRMPSSA